MRHINHAEVIILNFWYFDIALLYVRRSCLSGSVTNAVQHGGSILGSIILHGTFQQISQLWDNPHTFDLENCLLNSLSIISQCLEWFSLPHHNEHTLLSRCYFDCHTTLLLNNMSTTDQVQAILRTGLFPFCPNFFTFEKAVQKNKPKMMD